MITLLSLLLLRFENSRKRKDAVVTTEETHHHMMPTTPIMVFFVCTSDCLKTRDSEVIAAIEYNAVQVQHDQLGGDHHICNRNKN